MTDPHGRVAGTDLLVRAAGTVPWRLATSGGHEVLVVHRPMFDDWTVPKGKVESGESFWQAALRETQEEAGAVGELGPELCGVAYRVRQGPKLVRYWLLRVTAVDFVANAEVDQMAWWPLDAAADGLTYQTDRAVLASAAARLLPVG